MNVLKVDRRLAVLSALLEGCSIRSTTRLTGHHKKTVLRLLVESGEHCEALLERELRRLPCPIIEADEVWTFCRRKQERLIGIDSTNPEIGDQYLFVGFHPASRLVAAHAVGKRDAATTVEFLAQLRRRVATPKIQLFTDGFIEYPAAITQAFDDYCNHAQVIAPERVPVGGSYAPTRGRPRKKLRIVKRLGQPEDAAIGTSYVERNNGTIRQQLRRFTRKTLGFSKKLRNLRAAVALYVAWYDFVRPHGSLHGCTPAMALGLAETFWPLERLLP